MRKTTSEIKRMTDDEKRRVEDNHNLIYGYLNDKDLDIEEFYDIAAIGLCKASMNYDCTKGKFSTYAYKIMDIEIKRYYYLNNMQCRKPSGLIFSYDVISKIDSTGDTGGSFINSYIADDKNDYDDIIVDIDYSLFFETLNEREKNIITYIESGYNQKEIGVIMGKTKQAISKIVVNIKKKWLKFIK